VLKKDSEEQGKPLDDCFYESLQELKDDPDFVTLAKEFDQGLRGKRNILTIGMYVL